MARHDGRDPPHPRPRRLPGLRGSRKLTGAKVECTSEKDTGSALNRALRNAGNPEFDIIYGIDNILMTKAVDGKLFRYYTPQLAHRVALDFRFFADAGSTEKWPATPVDHGYIALNVDSKDVLFNAHKQKGCTGVEEARAAGKDTVTPTGERTVIRNYENVRAAACLLVASDPRFSTPGLGYMLTTIANYGEVSPDNTYDWIDYWGDLFATGVKVTPDWSTAYETYFSGGYGIYTDGHVGDRPIVTSYTTSPAYEWYYDEVCPRNDATECPGGPGAHYNSSAVNLPKVLLDGPSAFHQIQTMGILRGTSNLAIAQAWIEYTLTDDFQQHAARDLAVYPIAIPVKVKEVYDGRDPAPGTFTVVELDYEHIGRNLDAWLESWTDLCESHRCA
jgi:thiamine transport system substrate-binding protein